MANTEGYRLVRCPKCLNVLPEPANVTVYKCGGCGTTLLAKIRTGSGRHVATKQVRQDSDSYSVATSVSNGVPPRNKDEASPGAATNTDGSCIADASSTEHDSNGTSSNENGNVQHAEKNAGEIENSEEEEDHRVFEDQNANSSEEGRPADLAYASADGTPVDSGTHAVEQCVENSDAWEERGNDDSERSGLNASENTKHNSERSKVNVSIQDSEQKETGETEHAVNKKSYLVRVHSRSCDLRASGNSLDFHSARTSLQSKSFRASEPLQSKIMNSVDELKGDLTQLFSKPSDCKPRALPPPSKQDGYRSRAAVTTSAPLAAARNSGHATRLTMSGHFPGPRGLPSRRYRRHRVYSSYPLPVEQMEMRPCRHECCHSCRPPCYRSCNHHEPAMHKPPVKEIRRRPPPKHHCRPVLRGSPFVICSNCLKLVQLPTDFTVPSKGTRRLRCGSCSEILSYSYRDPSRKKLQSPFGGDEYSSTDDYEEIHRAADDQKAGADPVSYSEEYGLSFGVSYSTSTEDGQPLYVSRNSSFNTVDERIMAKDGKLHRLMGYSSASELLRHSPDLFESFDGRTPDGPRSTLDRKGKAICDDCSGEQDSPVKRSKARSGGLPFQGILKRGIHGLESLKLRS